MLESIKEVIVALAIGLLMGDFILAFVGKRGWIVRMLDYIRQRCI